jgi:hypothetical protein
MVPNRIFVVKELIPICELPTWEPYLIWATIMIEKYANFGRIWDNDGAVQNFSLIFGFMSIINKPMELTNKLKELNTIREATSCAATR